MYLTRRLEALLIPSLSHFKLIIHHEMIIFFLDLSLHHHNTIMKSF